MAVSLTRRAALVGAFALAACPAPAGSDPFPAAIRRAEATDAADREAGRFAREIHAAGLPLPADWRAYRADLRQARTAARFELHVLTPATAEAAAAALAAYYRDRAETSGDPAAAHHAVRRRLRKVFRRPGAVDCPAALARASPA